MRFATKSLSSISIDTILLAVLCYSSAGACNADCLTHDCYPDAASCATGFAGGYAQNIWICPSDNALFTWTSAPSAAPNGKGAYCFMNLADCQIATNTSNCTKDVAVCATGQAGPSPLNIVHVADKYDYVRGVPNGAGILCFTDKASCEASNNNPCGYPSPFSCSQDSMTCATGLAGPLPVTYTCNATYPPGSLPNGAGQLCYDTLANCVGGPNACNDSSPCLPSPSICGTGVVGPTPSSYF